MATYRTTLNRILKLLGEDQVPDANDMLTDDYQILVGEFVNVIKEEVEDATQWRSLQTSYTLGMNAGQNSQVITGATERSRVVYFNDYQNGRVVPLVFDTTQINNVYPLIELTLSEIKLLIATQSSYTNANGPTYFAIDDTSSDAMNLMIFNGSSVDRSYEVHMVTPQAYLDVDDLDVLIKVPSQPVLLGSLWMALQERGEELGLNGMFTEERYRVALDAAVARDIDEQGGLQLVPV